MPNARLQYLFAKHLAKTNTDTEKQELAVLLLSPHFEEEVKELLQQTWDSDNGIENMPAQKTEEIIKSILTYNTPVFKESTAKTFSLWKRIAAAAAILLVISVSSYFVFKNKPAQQVAITE